MNFRSAKFRSTGKISERQDIQAVDLGGELGRQVAALDAQDLGTGVGETVPGFFKRRHVALSVDLRIRIDHRLG